MTRPESSLVGMRGTSKLQLLYEPASAIDLLEWAGPTRQGQETLSTHPTTPTKIAARRESSKTAFGPTAWSGVCAAYAAVYHRAACAPNTDRAYRCQAQQFQGWSERHGLESALPVAPAVVAAWLESCTNDAAKCRRQHECSRSHHSQPCCGRADRVHHAPHVDPIAVSDQVDKFSRIGDRCVKALEGVDKPTVHRTIPIARGARRSRHVLAARHQAS